MLSRTDVACRPHHAPENSVWHKRTRAGSRTTAEVWRRSRGQRQSRPTEWQVPRRPLEDVARVVERSRDLITAIDEEGSPLCSIAAWERAAQFLADYARWAWDNQGRRIELPEVLPGPEGSVDLHWRTRHFELLLNVPTDPSKFIEYFGDDAKGNTTKGIIVTIDNGGLLTWLMKRR